MRLSYRLHRSRLFDKKIVNYSQSQRYVFICYKLNPRGGDLIIWPMIKWTIIPLGVLVAIIYGVRKVIINIIYKEWSRNREKFENEYSEILTKLKKVESSVRTLHRLRHSTLNGPLTIFGVGEGLQTSLREINTLIAKNPKRIEDDLTNDWEKVKGPINQLIKKYRSRRFNNQDFREDELVSLEEDTLEKVEWLKDKVDNYYTCHFHRRMWYRLTS